MTDPQDPEAPDPSESPFVPPTTPPVGQPSPPPPYSAPPPYGAPPPPPYGAPPPPYGQQPYGQQYGQPYGQQQYGGYPPPTGTNGFAIASLVCAFLCSPLGLIFGLVAKSQIKQRGGGGDGLATAGIVLSIVFLAIYIILTATGHTTFHFGTTSDGQ